MIFLAEEKEEQDDETKVEPIDIKEAFSQFNSQLEDLLIKKKEMETKLKHKKEELALNQDEEFKKLHELEKMIEKGVKLNNSRIKLERDLDDINDKIKVLKKIHSELKEVWQ